MLFYGCSYFYHDIIMAFLENTIISWLHRQDQVLMDVGVTIDVVPTTIMEPSSAALQFLEDDDELVHDQNMSELFSSRVGEIQELTLPSLSMHFFLLLLAAGAMWRYGNSVFEL